MSTNYSRMELKHAYFSSLKLSHAFYFSQEMCCALKGQ
jgi:hypothetical protein